MQILEKNTGMSRIGSRLQNGQPLLPTFAVARTLIALSTLLTLILTDTHDLFGIGSGITETLSCSAYTFLSAYCWFGEDNIHLVKYASVLVLLAVISGYFPRITAVLHFLVSMSLFLSARTVDGGEQVAAILTFLLAIIAFADPRRNHWQKAKSDTSSILVFNTNIASFLIKAQVSVIYFQAATAKFKVEEWVNGTAMYYWMNSPYFGATGLFKTVVDPLLTSGFVTVITWLPLILEMALAFSFLMDLRVKRILLVLGITFHLMIAMLMGIGSFSIIMTAALILLLSPLDVKSFTEFYSSGIWAKLRILDRIRFT